MSKQITFYYDSYEKTNGDGNYPQLKECEACSSKIIVEFEKVWVEIWSGFNPKPLLWLPLVWKTKKGFEQYRKSKKNLEHLRAKLVWKQMDWDSIKGLDGPCGPDLFVLLEKNEPESSQGIVNLYGKFIYTPTTISKNKNPDEDKDTAISLIKYHTAMPYVLGGSVAKYQGMDETIEYLKRAHPAIFQILSPEEISHTINETIKAEQT